MFDLDQIVMFAGRDIQGSNYNEYRERKLAMDEHNRLGRLKDVEERTE